LEVDSENASYKQKLEVLQQQEELIEDEQEQEQREEDARRARKRRRLVWLNRSFLILRYVGHDYGEELRY